jgi:hypothetical protein
MRTFTKKFFLGQMRQSLTCALLLWPDAFCCYPSLREFAPVLPYCDSACRWNTSRWWRCCCGALKILDVRIKAIKESDLRLLIGWIRINNRHGVTVANELQEYNRKTRKETRTKEQRTKNSVKGGNPLIFCRHFLPRSDSMTRSASAWSKFFVHLLMGCCSSEVQEASVKLWNCWAGTIMDYAGCSCRPPA